MDSKQHSRVREIASKLPENIAKPLLSLPVSVQHDISEIRLRRNAPLVITRKGVVGFVSTSGAVLDYPSNSCQTVTKSDMDECLIRLCDYSVHSYQRELAAGFITIKGGHRVGVGGTAVYDDDGKVKGVRDITSFVIRVARSFLHSAVPLVKRLYSDRVYGTLIVGEPSSGKSTVLASVAHLLSSGEVREPLSVAISDERGELYPSLNSENSGGVDILSGYPKAEGITRAVRSLAPNVVVCDELATEEECRAVTWASGSGVAVIASVHAGSVAEFRSRQVAKLLLDTEAFRYIVMLKGRGTPGEVKEVIDLYDVGGKDGWAWVGGGKRLSGGADVCGGIQKATYRGSKDA